MSRVFQSAKKVRCDHVHMATSIRTANNQLTRHTPHSTYTITQLQEICSVLLRRNRPCKYFAGGKAHQVSLKTLKLCAEGFEPATLGS